MSHGRNPHIRRFTLATITITCLLTLPFHLRNLILQPRARAAAVIQNSVPVSSVSAASFIGGPAPLAPNSIVAAFGTQLATGTAAAVTQPLPTSLLSTNVTINGEAAPLFFVSPNQVNFLVPPGTPAGDAQVVITSDAAGGDQIVSRGTVKVTTLAPAIFTANANGAGVPAAVTGRVNASGQFVYDPNPPFEPNPLLPGQFLPAPIDVGTDGQPAFLILFATGLRNAPGGSTRAIIGGIEVAVTPVAAPGFTGLDQVNLQIPASLKGQGIVDVTLVASGVSSNPVQVNLAGGASGMLAISGFSTTAPAIVGQTVTINGSGFSTTSMQNIVRFGAAQGRVISSSASQISVIVPFGAESSRVVVQTPQGEVRSDPTFQIRTSVSGLVQSTGSATTSPAPLGGVTVRVVGTNISVQTNPQGTFVIPNLNPGVEFLEVDGGTTGANPPFPKVTLKAVIRADRDNQFTQAISMQQVTGGSGNVGGTLAKEGPLSELNRRLTEVINHQQWKTDSRLPATDYQSLQPLPGPAKNVVISSGGVTLEFPIGTNARFPDGKTSGQVQLTVVQRSRLPGISPPIGVYSTAIAQITPLGTTFSPGASISFPNPDQNVFGPGAKIDLYRYDFQTGAFIKRGTGTVSADRTRVMSDSRVVDLASFWLTAAASSVTTVRGRVIDGLGAPVGGAKVSVNGRWNSTDTNGGFTIPDVATIGVQQVQAEAILPLQYGVIPRGTSALTNVVAGGVTNVGNIALSNTNQAALVLSPFNIEFKSNSGPARLEVTLTQPAPGGGLTVLLASLPTTVATVPTSVTIPAGQTTASFNVTRTGPGVAFIEARASLGGNTLSTIAVVTVARPAPQLAGVSPASAPPGARITITGSGLKGIPDNNIVGFVRNNNLVAVLDPEENQIVFDTAGRPALRVVVPAIAAGAVGIVAATIDEFTGVISDTSNALNFTVVASSVPTPQLANVSPAQGRPREQVTINGSNFSTTAAENEVVFRQGLNESGARIIRATATQLVVEVPSQDIARGEATIIVRRTASNGARSAASNALDFTVTGDPTAPARPTIGSAVNVATGQPSGRDGDVIRVQGTNFGRNFYDVEADDVGNDEPLISILLYYQNNQLANFSLPIAAQNGTQINSVIPTGLGAGPVQITTVTFDLETGLLSDESSPINFSITVRSLRRIDEDEPNDSPETSTDVSLQMIVDGKAAKDDPAEYELLDENGAVIEKLHDWFELSLDRTTPFTFRLDFTQSADLDLFVIREDEDGDLVIVFESLQEQTIFEQISRTLPAGDYFIVVGAYSGSSRYSLTLQEGAPAFGGFNSNPSKFRVPVKVQRVSK